MVTIAAKVQYDGHGYCGFQRQSVGRTVQGELEEAIYKLTSERASVVGSGRTDAGVHAMGQVISFRTGAGIPPDRWAKALNTKLPGDIRVMSSCIARDSFNARFDAHKKLYKYLMLPANLGNALMRDYAWVTDKDPSVEVMRSGAEELKGVWDFSSFRSAGSFNRYPIRNLMRLDIEDVEMPLTGETGYLFYFEANGFLYKMVRNIVGALFASALPGGFGAAGIKELLLARDREIAPPPAPPSGLYLMEVNYPDDLKLSF